MSRAGDADSSRTSRNFEKGAHVAQSYGVRLTIFTRGVVCRHEADQIRGQLNMSSSSGDAARLLLDEANGFKKFDGSLSPTPESPAERRDRWRTWREVFGAACGIRNCAAVLTDDKPSGFDSKQIEIMQTDAKYLALIALSGPAKQWFLSDTTPPANGTIMNFMQHFEKIFAANERKDQDSVTKT